VEGASGGGQGHGTIPAPGAPRAPTTLEATVRFAVTVRVDVDQVRDLLIDVEPDATVSDLAGALGEAVGRAPDAVGRWSPAR